MPESTESDILVDAARVALLEITSPDSIGAPAGQTDEGDGVVSVLFECLLPGYPGWKWTVSVSTLPGEAPSVLEVELMPAEGALLSPDWVPWSDRLADYKAAQIAAGEEVEGDDEDESDDDETDDDDESEDDDDDDESDDDDDDDDEDSDDVIAVVHGGDVDGVDIDELDDADDDESDDDEADKK